MLRADGGDPPNSIYLFCDYRYNADDLVKWQLGKLLAQTSRATSTARSGK
jgi:hypothetical protein